MEEWIVDGATHRLDGPAMVVHDTPGMRAAGVSPSETFYVYDHELSREAHARFVEALDGGAPVEWALAYAEGGESDS